MFTYQYSAEEFGGRIRKIRRNNKMTQEKLADILILSVDSVSRIENGKVMCMPEHIVRICEIFNVTTDYLYFGTEKTKTEEAISQELLDMLKDCSDEDMERVIQMVKLFLKR